MRVLLKCGQCGGDNLSRDCLTEWSVEKQEWVISSLLDAIHCDDCADYIDIKQVKEEIE